MRDFGRPTALSTTTTSSTSSHARIRAGTGCSSSMTVARQEKGKGPAVGLDVVEGSGGMQMDIGMELFTASKEEEGIGMEESSGVDEERLTLAQASS